MSLVLLGLGVATSHGLSLLTSEGAPTKLEQVLVTIYLLLVGLVVEVVRWARESIDRAAGSVERVLDDKLSDSAEKAIGGAILRSVFPSGTTDDATGRIHFGIVDSYLRQVGGWPPLVQRASGVLVERHLAAWRDEMIDLIGDKGLPLKMDESARMSAAMVQGATSYLTIERMPCDPEQSWSPGFLKLIDELGSARRLEKRFVLLADRGTLWGEESSAERDQARGLYIREEEYLRRRGFQVFFCDERVVYKELGTTEIPSGNFEVFSEQLALIMSSADSYDRLLPVQLRPLAETDALKRFLLIVEEQAKEVNGRRIKTGRLG